MCRIDTKNELEYYKNGGDITICSSKYDLIMDEEIINNKSNTRNEKIKNFLIKKKKILCLIIFINDNNFFFWI